MAKVTITEAARLAGISRVTMYRKHIGTGQISVEKDRDGKPQIDTSELIRVFGEIHEDTGRDSEDTSREHHDTIMYASMYKAELAACKTLLASKEDELRRSLEREAWLQARIEASEQKLLTGPETKHRWWWPW
ncbi:hypothetical protein HFU84_01755 [Acidithiobacillus sp. CV18-2]|uniref:hypothetical protein n=1 Tax=Acidithiobacillus caldus TaxID=33059 RepID=UPI001C07AC2A|nr:hypothetical protein [Acidithiobacillus caldus]MBU2753433.1 hypothetical protein [Acidithiobacillus sp. CV18-3]MBU2756297.1 hypothetical protein [Acidithiobacillus sp. BN09-2]MBU2776261.1 hypothetical protein [Acidithiobacillus sp. CV18-2]MBU2800027.1 hypothetical protein [Acidithiobacillus sp. VAN18-4]MBU2763725.1 hypothetical protein [Acidithiobacillus caldus]